MGERNLDFDRVIDRRNSGSIKWNNALNGRAEDDLPLWVADMDFRTSSYIEDAMTEAARSGIYGYTYYKKEYWEAVKRYWKTFHNYEPHFSWMVRMPGVIVGMANAVRAFTTPGDSVLVQEPVYMHFLSAIRDNGRKVVSSNLVMNESGQYEIDFADFEQKIVDNHIRLFFLCNPHNPGGRVWTREELTRLGEICVNHDVIIASDDIHCDFVWSGKHTFISELDPAFAERSIICTAPSKTFNTAGLLDANIFISNPDLMCKYRQTYAGTGMLGLGQPAQVSTIAAYLYGDEWRQAVLQYIDGNLDYAVQYIAENIPQLKTVKPEGTYMLWIDCRPLDAPEVSRKSHVFLNDGADFGAPGRGFLRLNAACPRSTLTEALKRLKKGVQN